MEAERSRRWMHSMGSSTPSAREHIPTLPDLRSPIGIEGPGSGESAITRVSEKHGRLPRDPRTRIGIRIPSPKGTASFRFEQVG